jgi:hypothetical protein
MYLHYSRYLRPFAFYCVESFLLSPRSPSHDEPQCRSAYVSADGVKPGHDGGRESVFSAPSITWKVPICRE